MNNQPIEDILLRGHYVSAADINKAKEFAKERHVPVVEYLLKEQLITNDLLGQAIAESYGVPYADLNSHQPPREQVLKIPEKIAKKYRVVLFTEEAKQVTITTDKPQAPLLLKSIKPLFKGKKLLIAYSLSEDIDTVFIHYRKALETRFVKIIKRHKRVAPEILEEIFEDALSYKASDIHLEPQAREVIVRFRIDGVLQEAGRLPKEHYENILNRIKVQARLRIDEHFAAQDGSMRYIKDNNVVDLRISIVPALDGEKIAIRVLAKYVQGFGLEDLGLLPAQQRLLEKAAKRPFGMILVTGPTGSGKTTTLYAVLKILNRPEVNITTIEDPVEYKIAGVNQIQVNPQTNLTFAKGLRSIVRQDPDIILIGEIRDKETAEIAINAALTGHLMLSTFHANDAATAIPRLLDMGMEPFLLASTLEIIAAQRLVRKICKECRYSITLSAKDIEKKTPEVASYFSQRSITLYQAKGCNACSGTGYWGRTAIFEFIPMTPLLQELVLNNPSAQQIWELARKQGSRVLFEDGVEKVKNGITTLEELLRVAAPPQTVGTNAP